MGNTIRFFLVASALNFCVLVGSSTEASPISYVGPSSDGNMTGWWAEDIWYANVQESNDEGPNDSSAMLFGAPSGTTGSSIQFSPANFLANSENGESGSEIVDSTLTFMVVAGPNAVINNFQFEEFGDTTLARGFNPSLDAFTSITASFFVTVAEVDGAPIAPITVTGSMSFSPSDGDYQLSVDSPGSLSYTEIFEGSVFFDIDQILADEGVSYEFGATKLNVSLDNTLTAISEVGSSAFIKKKVANGITVTTNVPEPSTAILVMLAITSVAATRRS